MDVQFVTIILSKFMTRARLDEKCAVHFTMGLSNLTNFAMDNLRNEFFRLYSILRSLAVKE